MLTTIGIKFSAYDHKGQGKMWNWLREELTFKRLSLRLEDASVLTASAVSTYMNIIV